MSVSAFEESTHFRFWLFSAEELKELREAAHHSGAQYPRKKMAHARSSPPPVATSQEPVTPRNRPSQPAFAMTPGVVDSLNSMQLGSPYAVSIMEMDSSSSSSSSLLSSSSSFSSSSSSSSSSPLASSPAGASRPRGAGEVLSAEQEAMLRLFFECKILEISDDWNFPLNIRATALTFFKRFFLRRSVTHTHPKLILASSLLMATKAEEAYIKVEDLARSTRVAVDALLKMELPFLEGIRFHLRIFLPYRPVDGFLKLLQLSEDTLGKLKARAELIIEHSFLSDLNFILTPAQVALCAILKAAEELEVDGACWAAVKERIAPSQPAYDALQSLFRTACESFALTASFVVPVEATQGRTRYRLKDTARCAELLPLLEEFSDPLSNPESDEYRHAQDRKAKRKEQARQEKMQKQAEAQQVQIHNLLSTPLGNGDEDFKIMKRPKK